MAQDPTCKPNPGCALMHAPRQKNFLIWRGRETPCLRARDLMMPTVHTNTPYPFSDLSTNVENRH